MDKFDACLVDEKNSGRNKIKVQMSCWKVDFASFIFAMIF